MARKVGLALDDVAQAAAAVADRAGLDAVTLSAVADELGVRSPSLYAHVQGLEGLRRLLGRYAAGRLAAQLTRAAARHEGREALSAIAHAYRRFARRHPGWYDATQRAVPPGEDDALYAALAACVAPVFSALAQAGVGEADRVHLTRAFRAALHGFVSLEQGRGFGMPESVEQSFLRLVQLLLDGVTIVTQSPAKPA